MLTPNVSLEGIVHEGSLDLSLSDWQQLLNLARCFGWQLANEKLWSHYYSPIVEPEPIPAADARRLADALEGALAPRCSHNQIRHDPAASFLLLEWVATSQGKRITKDVVNFLRKGACLVSYEG